MDSNLVWGILSTSTLRNCLSIDVSDSDSDSESTAV